MEFAIILGFFVIGVIVMIIKEMSVIWENPENQIRKESIEIKERQKELAYTTGLEKFYKMDVDECERRKAGIEAMQVLGSVMPKSVYQEKEIDWSLLGGIAEGIAGPAAGIAVAAEAMKENAKIQDRNDERMKWAREQSKFYLDLARQAESKGLTPVSMYELNKKYMVNKSWSVEKLFSLIKINSTSTYTNTDGSVTVRAKWTQSDKSLCIDGSLIANLYTDTGTLAGCAYLVLPKIGTAKFSGELVGLCAEPLSSTNYKVKIIPLNLWSLEPKR